MVKAMQTHVQCNIVQSTHTENKTRIACKCTRTTSLCSKTDAGL